MFALNAVAPSGKQLRQGSNALPEERSIRVRSKSLGVVVESFGSHQSNELMQRSKFNRAELSRGVDQSCNPNPILQLHPSP